MSTLNLDDAQAHLREIVAGLQPGEEVVLTDNGQPVATLRSTSSEKPHPVPGRGKGMLTIISEDDDHLKDFAEYMP